MNGMLVNELAHLMEQEHMRASLMAQENRAQRRRRRARALRALLGGLVGSGRSRAPRAGQTPPQPSILAPGIRREAR
jgi:hypothetical protein